MTFPAPAKLKYLSLILLLIGKESLDLALVNGTLALVMTSPYFFLYKLFVSMLAILAFYYANMFLFYTILNGVSPPYLRFGELSES